MFDSYYCNDTQQARPVHELTGSITNCWQRRGNKCSLAKNSALQPKEWNAKTEKERQEILMNYRIAYLGETMVNWCPQLGTVLANDEVVDEFRNAALYRRSEKMRRDGVLRVSAYAQRLLSTD